MHPLEVHFRDQLARHHWHSVTCIVAISGGADSVAMLRMLRTIRPEQTARCIVAHFHHGLRGEAADADARFVENLARQFGFDFVLGEAAKDLSQQGDSLEAAARAARYRFFEEVANAQGARYLFTAHTADDQAETILHRILRGTGLDGLAGIPRVRPLSPLTTIVRPLLSVRRTEILEYLQAIGQDYREDHTNSDISFTRNRLRHELLPQLAVDYNPNVVDALLRLGELAGEAQACLDKDIQQWHAQAVQESGQSICIDCRALANASPYLVRQLLMKLWGERAWPLQPMTYEKWQALAGLALSPADGTLNLPGDIRAKKQGEQLTLTRPENMSSIEKH